MHITERINTGNHGSLRVEKGALDGANQQGFQAGFLEEVMMSCDQGFQEEVAMRAIISVEAEVLADPSWRKSPDGCLRVWVKLPS